MAKPLNLSKRAPLASPGHMRVRVHLNLGHPELAENVVRIKAASGAWITVAYATELVLENCIPVVNHQAQERIRQGASKKTPHAFIEGDLAHFKGRLREKAPPHLVKKALPGLIQQAGFTAAAAREDKVAINYNPRFASCFYLDNADKSQISQKFEACPEMVVVGWNFGARAPNYSPILDTDRCDPASTKKSSFSELLAIRKGRRTTEELAQTPPRPGLSA